MAYSSDGFAAFTVAFAMFSDAMIYDLVIPFLPEHFKGRLGTPENEIEKWTTLSLEAFGIALFLSNLVAGYITERCKSKTRPFILGIGVMLASTLFFFLGTTPEIVILARALQGASAAFVWVSGIAFLVFTVDESNLGTYMGYTTMGATMGELAGPLVGGFVYDKLGHWAVFGVVEAILAADIGLRVLIKSKSPEKKTEENTQQVSETEPLLGDQQRTPQNSNGTSKPRGDLEANGDVAHWPEQAGKPASEEVDCITSLSSLRDNWFTSVVAAVLAGVVRCGLEATIPLFVLRQFDWSPSMSGAVMFALLAPSILSPVVGRYTTRYGPRWLSAGAFTACGFCMVSLGFLSDNNEVTQALFILNVALIGVCIAIIITTHTIAITTAAQKVDQLRGWARTSGQELGWGLQWLTSGMMLSGLGISWSLGMILGSASADAFHFSTSEEWMRLCCFLGGLSWVTGIWTSFTWRKW